MVVQSGHEGKNMQLRTVPLRRQNALKSMAPAFQSEVEAQEHKGSSPKTKNMKGTLPELGLFLTHAATVRAHVRAPWNVF